MNEVFTKKTGERISDHLKDKGIKVAWLARQIGTSRPYLSNMISGVNKLTQEYLDKINEALQTEFKL